METYAPVQIVEGLHNITHLTYKFAKLNASETSGAGLDVTSWEYLDCLIFFAGVALVAGIISLLIVSICLCCCCCCTKRRSLYSLEPRRGTGCARGFVIITTVLCVALTAGSIWTEIRFSARFSDVDSNVQSVYNLFTEARTNATSAITVANSTMDLTQQLIQATASDPKAPTEQLNDLSTQLQAFVSAAGDVEDAIPALDNEQQYSSDAKKYVRDWTIGVVAISGLFAFVCFCFLMGACTKNRGWLSCAVALSILLLVVSTLLKAALFSGSVLSADVCVEPTEFVNARVHLPDYAYEYMVCTNPTENPLSSQFAPVNAALTEAHVYMAVVLNYCENESNSSSVKAMGLDLQNYIKALSSSISAMEQATQCEVPHNDYIATLESLCNQTVPCLIWLLACLAGMSLLLTVMNATTLRIWHNIPTEDGDEDEIRPLLTNIQSNGKDGGSRRRWADAV